MGQGWGIAFTLQVQLVGLGICCEYILTIKMIGVYMPMEEMLEDIRKRRIVLFLIKEKLNRDLLFLCFTFSLLLTPLTFSF